MRQILNDESASALFDRTTTIFRLDFASLFPFACAASCLLTIIETLEINVSPDWPIASLGASKPCGQLLLQDPVSSGSSRLEPIGIRFHLLKRR